ncbi:biliverdin-producing heme oxygenase [Streptomyces sp. NPDC058686]|uniref:biliverdin-producing heme oxygenase n=1 Tax=Streptomyces sp. NPDC058686 TaxID=3346599 RepID=UPI00365EC1CC
MTGQQRTTTPIAERLRTAMRSAHGALETTPFAAAMFSGTLPLERYVTQLAAHGVILATLEDELSRATEPAVAQVWSADLVKLPLIEHDLRFFAGRDTVAHPPEQADHCAAEVRRTARTDATALLGFLYVLEGSTLGARFLLPRVRTAYQLREPDGLAYYASGDRDRWARFTARLNGALTAADAQDRVLAAATAAYRHIAHLARALSTGLTPAPASASNPARTPGPTPGETLTATRHPR